MELKNIKNEMGYVYVNVNGTDLVFWNVCYNSGSVIALANFGQSFKWEGIEHFKDGDEESVREFILNNEEFILNYITRATLKEELEKSYSNIPKKKLVTVDKNGEIKIISIELNRNYVAVTCYRVFVAPEKELIRRGKEMLIDHYVSEGKTEEEAEEIVDNEIRWNGIESVADISLFSGSFTHENEDYFFESSGCGQLDLDEAKQHFPDNTALHKLIELHLKEVDNKALWYFSQIKTSDDYAEEVIEIGKKVLTS